MVRFEPYFRWSVEIPIDSVITSSSISLVPSTTTSASILTRIRLLDYDDANSVDWSSDPRPLKNTSTTVDWTPANWTANTENANSTTPDISNIVQSFIDRAGYSLGNYIGVVFNDVSASSGNSRSVRGFEANPLLSARLTINYLSPATIEKSSDITSPVARETIINVADPEGSKTVFQIFREEQDSNDVPTDNDPYPITINSTDEKPSNIIELSDSKLSIWLPPKEDFKVRYRFDDNGTWSRFKSFTSVGYLNSYDRYLILSGLA